MEIRKILLMVAALAVLMVGVVRAQNVERRMRLLSRYESNPAAFKEYVNDKGIAYWQQRMIGEAIVEKDQIVYQFDNVTEELIDVKMHWREDVPMRLPKLGVTQEKAESWVEGEVQWSTLYIISPDSDVFSPIQPTPTNSCWVVTSLDDKKGMLKTVIDSIEGDILGYGIVPPYTAFSLSGPQYDSPCSGTWTSWYTNAEYWFDEMGYNTEAVEWPSQNKVKSHIQSNTTAMFYELAHGGSTSFQNDCYGLIRASEVEEWITNYTKKPFTFIGSCDGMCSTGDNTLSYEFRKGSTTDTVTVGYCNMSYPKCDTCWNYSVSWQDTLFEYMSYGGTVKDAIDQANLDYPACGDNECMRLAGDEGFRAKLPVHNETQDVWYETIQGAIDEAVNGDEIVADRITYKESIDFGNKAITVRSSDPNDWDVVEATIINDPISIAPVTFDGNEGADSILKGFTITGGFPGISCAGTSPTIGNCLLKDNSEGIHVLYSSGNPSVTNCRFEDNAGSGIGVDCANATISNCTFKGNGYWYGYYPYIGGILIVNSSPTIKNCNIYDNYEHGIKCWVVGGTCSPEITNCTLVNNDNGVYCDPSTTATITNCIIWDNSEDDLNNCSATYSCIEDPCDADGPGNITSDPCFVNAGANDFHLELDSPCINTGDPCYVPDTGETDIDGDDRKLGGRVDMGADEAARVHNITKDKWYWYINKAIDDASGGDVIVAYENTYYENVDFDGKDITVRSTDPCDPCVVAATIIDGGTRAAYFHNNEDSDSILEGFTLTGASSYGVYCYKASPTIKNNIITDNGSHGIYIYASVSGHSAKPKVENNKIHDNSGRGIYAKGDGSAYGSSRVQPTIKNNWIYWNGSYGIYSYGAQPKVYNNTIVSNTTRGIAQSSQAPGSTTVKNCIVWDNGDDLYRCSATYSCIQDLDGGTGNIHTDPNFVDATSDDYHLKPISPCINTAAPYYVPEEGETDIDGEPRVMRGRLDMGGDEDGRVQNIDQNISYVYIQDAIGDAADGDTIVAYPGTYYETINFDGKAITVRSIDPNDLDIVKATIIDPDGTASAVSFDSGEDEDSELAGFTLSGSGGSAVFIYSSDPVISSCIIKGNASWGIYTRHCDATIRNNLIFNNQKGVYIYYGSPIVINNTIVDNTDYGIGKVGTGTPPPTISNCILWGNGDDLPDDFRSYVTYSCLTDPCDATGTGNISDDPLFIDPNNEDYHLNMNSPCINAGDPCYSPASGETDIDGDERVLGGRIDMGGDETCGRVYNINQDMWYCGIQDAIDEATSGDKIVAYEDTYYENVDFDGKAITVRSSDPCNWEVVESTIIDAGGSGYTVIFDSAESASSVLDGFTITNPVGRGIYCYNADPTVKNCIIENSNAIGFECGIGASPIVINNIIRGNGGPGIMSTGAGSVPSVQNNLIYDNDSYGIQIWFGGSAEITNNTIVGNTSFGILNFMGGTAPTITNCIIWDNGNDLHGCSATYSCIQDIDPGEGNIVGDPNDPLFVNPNEGDYCLGYGSPCIDAANGNVDPPTDMFGQARIDDPATPNTGIGDPNYVDMGACEYNPN